ncbi:hypothetical protein [Pseudomonas syringae]|uniref:Uncharacterized protein n=1 Tax=Pseudomonas syringae pv. atrofaciens TaxID=192087 RepID=A0AAD0MZI1_PSESX|nr:hypothetical protein [Pseudomonas syringae]AVX23962.1 hypothetical protein DA456_11410 [Pseudomonas syringae pv. atrofaciens]ELP97926.1 hypothetical protein A987_22446 [Pseudomonas syringae BRIP34881]ELQ04533.1 hypothetical protein A979_02419 [Pseudomonas syringae BRIP34876]ELS43930.1 Hypothetical protein PSSB64_4297 [Pseudomonas syringae pv. syringae B64]EPF65686.1 Hypothetical protein PssSM_1593 [Pseudomonas syringae pv. syringae SM]
MMSIVKIIIKSFVIFLIASFLTRYLIGSGLVRKGLETSIGDALYTTLSNLFNVNGSEQAETLVISVLLIASLVLVTILGWLASIFTSRPYQEKLKK